jgi:hypothetical protein
MRSHDIMVDIETQSLAPNAAIIQIGAVQFDPMGDGIIGDPFLVSVEPICYEQKRTLRYKFGEQPNLADGVHWSQFDVDPVTVKWWGEQGSDAQAALDINLVGNPWDALNKFTEWVNKKSHFVFGDSERSCFWSQGWLDIVAIEYACKVTKVPEAWKYYQHRDSRSFIEENLRHTDEPYPDIEHKERLVAHRADHDAIRQVYQLQYAYNNMKNDKQQEVTSVSGETKS